ncbi:MAG TPA: hypothetical protein VFJ16_17195 [Longimicrobium sp.]|nr:hypothetical protein [Longimicrobium sp.]
MTTRSLCAAALLSLTALGACGKEGGSSSDGPLPAGITALSDKARLPVPERPGNCYSAPTRMIFHNQQEWEQFWTNERRGCTAPPVPAGVDFSKEMMVYAAMGKRMSPQDEISIDGTGVRNDTLLVFLRRSMLAPGCSGREAVFPQSLVKIPTSTQYVRFSEEHRKIPCGGTQP